MNTEIHLHDVVALLEDLPARHFETEQPLWLRRGQIGTVVMVYDDGLVEIEFADPGGHTYAMLPIETGKLMPLRDVPEYAAA
jgi:hypothetical protein